MGAPVYATAEDVAAHYAPAQPPAEIGAPALRAASRMVDRMALTAVYRVDSHEMPLDPDVRDAFREATILQAAHTIEYGTEAEIAEASVPVSLGPLKIGLGDRGGSQGGSGGGVGAFSTEAAAALRAAGLIVGALQ
ncbi:hypothetical protein PQI23_13355 [Leucobacter sp. USCH14]|uniref:hypothetical protein n=1 Tax=Leucobacter sp. USCH14 TaxID=3024838 RepID=UPI00309F017C